MKRLYRHVYFYTLLILILSLILSAVGMGLLFGEREKGMLSRAFRHQVLFIRREMIRYELRQPEQVPERLRDLSEQLGWDLAYWQNGQLVFSSLPEPPSWQMVTQRLKEGNKPLFQDTGFRRPQVVLSLFPRHPQQRVLWMQLRLGALSAPLRGPLLALLLLLLFLAILLIPLTRFLLRPYRDLQRSIDQLAEGRFENRLNPAKYSAFEELVTAFNQMQTRLQQMMQQKQRLVADVSHELRSPLTRLRMLLELLLQRQPESQEMVERAIEELQELNLIIDDVLEISRLQLHHLPLEQKPLDLTWVLFQIAERHQEAFEQKDLQLEVDLPDQAIKLTADDRLLKRLFENLFSNLVKYVPGGRVDLKVSQNPEMTTIVLRDHGPGLSPEELKEIFTPFYRSDLSRSRRTGGVGLGLAIVWEIVKAHQGQIIAFSPEDGQGGLAFKITLPNRSPVN